MQTTEVSPEIALELEPKVQSSNSFLDDLLTFVEESEVEELDLTAVSEGFSIQSMDQANYIARKLKEVRAEQSEAELTAKRYLSAYQEKVQNWLEKVSNPLKNQEEFYLRLLEDFAAQKLEGSSKKSLKLIEGTLQFRKQTDQYEYEDETLLAFAEEELPEYIKIKPSVDKSKLKKDGTVRNGQLYINDKLVPGVTVTAREDKFDVK